MGICLVACSNGTPKQRPGPSTLHAPERYWLKNTTLLETPGGRPTHHVEGPLLVELLDGGHVRSVDRGATHVEGYLPEQLLDKPQPGQGLMLYVQQVAELRYGGHTGPVIGRLHPGALVSVVRLGSEGSLVGSLPFQPADLIGYVKGSALGSTVRELRAPEYDRGGRAYIMGMIPGVPFPSSDGARTIQWNPCEPLWIDDATSAASQAIKGVELMAHCDRNAGVGYSPWEPRRPYSMHCPATTILAQGTRLVLQTPHGVGAVKSAPNHLGRIQDGTFTMLRGLMEREEDLHWVVFIEKEPSCIPVRFRRPRPWSGDTAVLETTLVRREGTQLYRYATRLFPGNEARPPRLVMDSAAPPGSSLCCEYNYALVGVSADELLLLGRRIPDHAVAYDPREVERWYRSRERCETARAEVERAVLEQPQLVPFLGTHARRGVPGSSPPGG